jgi:hypothetical protein
LDKIIGVQCLWFDTTWKDLGIGCVRVVEKEVEGVKKARFVFSLPPATGKGRDKVLVNGAIFKGMRVDASTDASKPVVTVDLYVTRAEQTKLQRYSLRVKTPAMMTALADAIKTYT